MSLRFHYFYLQTFQFKKAIFIFELQQNAKVAVMGASGGIGQPMSLLFKESSLVTELSLYDITNTPGVAADLSHINTASKVKGYTGPDQLKESLKGVQVLFFSAIFLNYY